MKKIFSIAASMLLLSSVCFAQTEITAKVITGDELPDSLKYAVSEFKPGRIIFKNGAYSNGVFNIATLDQVVRYIDENGQVLALNNNADVDRVTIGRNIFIHISSGYMGVSSDFDDIYLGAVKNVSLLSGVKTGAYGMESQTTNIKQLSSIYSDSSNGAPQTYDLTQTIKTPFRYTVIPFLYKKGAAYPATINRFKKFFPAQKAFIEDFCYEHKTDFENFNDVYDLFEALKQQK